MATTDLEYALGTSFQVMGMWRHEQRRWDAIVRWATAISAEVAA
jgi:hypothetical protein